MKLLRGVSVQANGFRSTAPRYLTSTVSELTGAAISKARAATIDRIMTSSTCESGCPGRGLALKLDIALLRDRCLLDRDHLAFHIRKLGSRLLVAADKE